MKKLLIPGILLLVLFSSCKKSDQASPNQITQYASLPEVKQALMEKIIAIAKSNPQFKKTIEDECLKQVRGDYNVALERIIEIDHQTPILPAKEKNLFASLVKQMKDFRPNEMPIIFVPVMESRDPHINKNNLSSSMSNPDSLISDLPHKPINYIIMVDQDNQVFPKTKESKDLKQNRIFNEPPPGDDPGACPPPYYYPGFIINDLGAFTYYDCISESMAWNNDVWVLGYEEEVSPGIRL